MSPDAEHGPPAVAFFSEDSVFGSVAGDLLTTSREMACRFAAGATMWCTAPELPWQAHRLAAEFSNSVVGHKRALPAVAVEGDGLVNTLRSLTSSGDLLVAIAGAEDEAVRGAARRATAWGVRSIWIGRGRRPPPGAADHVLWLGDELAAVAPDDGALLVGHRLWELTHECLERSGQVGQEVAGVDAACTDEVCITCSDEGRLAEVVSAGPGYQARVRTAAGMELIDTALIGTPDPGDLVLVHAGFAISLIDD